MKQLPHIKRFKHADIGWCWALFRHRGEDTPVAYMTTCFVIREYIRGMKR